MKTLGPWLLVALVAAGLGFAADTSGRGRGGNAAVNGGSITPANVTAATGTFGYIDAGLEAVGTLGITSGCAYGPNGSGSYALAYGYCYESGSQSLLFRNNSSEQWRVSGASGDFTSALSRNVSTAGQYISSAASGNNGFGCTTNGCRVDYGAGASDYGDSDGTTVTFHGPVAAAGITSSGNLIARSAGFSQFSVGPAGNAYLNVSNTGLTTGILGSISAQVNFNGTLATDVAAHGNAADTTEDTLATFPLPAASITLNGQGVRVTAWGDNNAISTTDVMTVRCYFGATAVFTRILTASQSNTWRTQFEVMRTGATTQITSGQLFQQGTVQFWQQLNGTAAETLSGIVVVKCTGQRATTSTANSVRQLGFIVESIE